MGYGICMITLGPKLKFHSTNHLQLFCAKKQNWHAFQTFHEPQQAKLGYILEKEVTIVLFIFFPLDVRKTCRN